jgi:acyl-CoA thioesterase superfamily protein
MTGRKHPPVADCFYLPAGDDTWLATQHTTGPWDARAQHGGPPSALLGRAVQRFAPRDDMIVARFTCDILGAIPVGEIRVQARLARPGRSVELLAATASADGREVARATAWRVLRSGSPAVPPRSGMPPGPAAKASRVTTYQGWGNWTPALETGHQSAIGAVNTSRKKCAQRPQAAPAVVPVTIAALAVPAARDRRPATAATAESTATTHPAWV